ncbi:hypothetical protein LUZ60_013565 [Juncus effusus]|nr:hypothetical protein LUZ60_013565 [Juncus effusus]
MKYSRNYPFLTASLSTNNFVSIKPQLETKFIYNSKSPKRTNNKKKNQNQEIINQPISMEEMASLKNHLSFEEESISTVPSIDPMIEEEEEEDDDDDSDFSFVISSSDMFNDKFPNITADELFSHGKILPVYPVFGNSRSFKREEIEVSDTASVSHPANSEFCDWVPKSAPTSPERCRKSRSTGSTRKWLFHDFLLGGRSHSDGKQKFIFLNKDGDNKKKEKEITEVKEKDMAKMYKAFYGNKAEKKKEKEKGKRKSYLPYVGFFGGGLNSNEGFTRSSYPF